MWKLTETNYNCDCAQYGTKFLLANGYTGFRGTLDEFSKDKLVAWNIGTLYDGVVGKWRETVNAPNPLYVEIKADGCVLGEKCVTSHLQQLDIQNALFSRKTHFSVNGKTITLASTRFLEEQEYSRLASRLTVECDKDCDIEILCAVDTDVWDINGPHLQDFEFQTENFVRSICKTQESNTSLTVGLHAQSDIEFAGFYRQDKVCGYKFKQRLQGGKTYTIDRFCCVAVGCDNTQSLLLQASTSGFDQLLQQHQAEWCNKWKIADVQIFGDDDAQFALRYSIFQLLSLSPKTAHSISARGLSGQTYKGAIFWDTEIFLLPFFTATQPQTAKKLLQYRINTLQAAIDKARHYKFDGAFFAWESQEHGQDACSDFNVTDVFSNRPLRTFFKDKQIHISGDIAYAMYKHFLICNDIEILANGGCRLLLKCAEFYYSYAYYNHTKKRFELLDVLGPDEYHERVNNNAYTNYIAYFTVKYALEALSLLEKSHPQIAENLKQSMGEQLLENLKDFADQLYLPTANQQGIIEQFDGYLDLEDVTVDTVASRLLHPKEYWGGANGVASSTRVIKQADIVTMFAIVENVFDKQTVEDNWKFYLRYTEHGSSLSYSMYSLTACKIGQPNVAYPYFVKTANVDLSGKSKQYAGTIYIGGTHPASCGGAWMTAVFGFGGLGYDKQGRATINPNLPDKLTKIVYRFFDKNILKQVTATKNGFTTEEVK